MQQYISTPSKTAEILAKHGIRLRKSLGQNFLVDANVLKNIINHSNLSGNDTVLEIGCGIGSLTEFLLNNSQKIICIEIDERLIDIFKEIFCEYIDSKILLIVSDAMKLDYLKLSGDFGINKVISNLPYKIAAPLLLKLLKEALNISKMYFTIQKDIACRLFAKTGDKNYNAFSIKANFLADFKCLFPIQRNCFMPAPFVDSVFIEVRRKETTGNAVFLNNSQRDMFFSFIDACFLHRRKKLVNSLIESGTLPDIDKTDLIIKMLYGIGKDRSIRAEELSKEDFLNLFLSLSKWFKG